MVARKAPPGRAYRTGEPAVIADVQRDPDVHDSEPNLGGHLYLPLGDHGILIAGSEKRAAFDQQDLALGELLAATLVAALDRVEREATARQRQQQLSLFFDESPLGAVQWDDEFRFERVNERAEEILGYDEATLCGKSWETIVTDEDSNRVGDAVEKLLAADGGTHVLNTNVRKDGEMITCEWHNRAVTDADGNVQAVFSKFQDVTDQVERRQELEKQNERLEEFASIVSHDLRSPLSIVEGRLELAQETCESAHLTQAADALDRSQALIDDLLRLAREGETVGELEPVDLGDVAKRSWQTVETGSTAFETHTTQTFRADRSRLQELVENLYRNAVEHGGDDVTVSVGAMDNGFYVADTGPGIPEDDREEIFEAGYSTNEDGTGFGLRIVEHIANAHGWEIAVTESEQGGARFEITGVVFADR